jgi:membrane protein DedA with SNARE-associated domain
MALGIVGLPIPDETILAFSGFFVFQDHLHFIPTIVSAFLGSISGISLSFFIGIKFGTRALKRFGPFLHVNDEKLEKVHRWFEKQGHWLLFFGYFIPGVRHITAIIAGSAKTKYSTFAVYAYSGCLLWTNTFILLGFFSGKHWGKVKDKIQDNILPVILIAAVLIFLYSIGKKILANKIRG